ncbi:MAG: hypothetical protein WCI89_03885 [bacterium]
MSQKEQNTAVWSEVEPRTGLCSLVLLRIAHARRSAARVRTFLLGVVALGFGTALVPIVHYTMTELYASGFYEYLSLLFSDNRFVFSSAFRELAFSLVESLPSVAILLVAGASVGLLWSLARAIPNAKIAFARGTQTA